MDGQTDDRYRWIGRLMIDDGRMDERWMTGDEQVTDDIARYQTNDR